MPVIAGWIITALLWLFKSRMGFMVTQLLVWLGINYGTVTMVVGPAIDAIRGQFEGVSASGQYGAIAMQWMLFLNFDRALTAIFSAYLTKHAVAGARMFLFKRGVGA